MAEIISYKLLKYFFILYSKLMGVITFTFIINSLVFYLLAHTFIFDSVEKLIALIFIIPLVGTIIGIGFDILYGDLKDKL